MLFATRVKKFGMVTIMAVLSGLLMGLTGMGFWGVPMGLVFGLWMVGTYIPMSVIFRFFPTIGEENAAISDAMRMRGIRFGGKHPGRMLEYRLIPLMISVVKIGDELSAAALTRGLGAPVRRTDICRIGFHVQDVLMMAVCAAGFVLTLGSRWLG